MINKSCEKKEKRRENQMKFLLHFKCVIRTRRDLSMRATGTFSRHKGDATPSMPWTDESRHRRAAATTAAGWFNSAMLLPPPTSSMISITDGQTSRWRLRSRSLPGRRKLSGVTWCLTPLVTCRRISVVLMASPCAFATGWIFFSFSLG